MVSFLSSTLIYSFPVCPHKVKMLSVADSMNTAVTGLQLVLVSIFQMVKNIAVVMKSFFFFIFHYSQTWFLPQIFACFKPVILRML